MTSQRYQSSPRSACASVGVNHTGRNMLSRSACSGPPRNSATRRGHSAATARCTRGESMEATFPFTRAPTRPAQTVRSVCGRSHERGLARVTGASAWSKVSR